MREPSLRLFPAARNRHIKTVSDSRSVGARTARPQKCLLPRLSVLRLQKTSGGCASDTSSNASRSLRTGRPRSQLRLNKGFDNAGYFCQSFCVGRGKIIKLVAVHIEHHRHLAVFIKNRKHDL
jgi:hypothetical protein